MGEAVDQEGELGRVLARFPGGVQGLCKAWDHGKLSHAWRGGGLHILAKEGNSSPGSKRRVSKRWLQAAADGGAFQDREFVHRNGVCILGRCPSRPTRRGWGERGSRDWGGRGGG